MKKVASVNFVESDFSVSEALEGKSWDLAEGIKVETYWSGEKAPSHRHFEVRLLWGEEAFYVRFEANQGEPLIISERPNLSSKTIKLWERDVCEIFLAPDKENFRRYFEFEVSPNGEWLDLEIYQGKNERITNWDYKSAMESVAKITDSKILMGIKIPWQAF
ncbi:MAG: sugar-binding protein, partial [Pyrinomonadaceae bacterium]